MHKFASIWKTSGTGDVLKYMPLAAPYVGYARAKEDPHGDTGEGTIRGLGAGVVGSGVGAAAGSVLGGAATVGALRGFENLPPHLTERLTRDVAAMRGREIHGLGDGIRNVWGVAKRNPRAAALIGTSALAGPVLATIGASLGSAHALDKYVPKYTPPAQPEQAQAKISSFVRKGGLL